MTKKKQKKFVLPWQSKAFKNYMQSRPQKRKRRKLRKFRFRRPKKGVLIALAAVLVLILLLVIPDAVQKSKLKKLGYNDVGITALREQKLAKLILDNGYYSDFLQQNIIDGTLNTDYIELYTAADAGRGLTDLDFLVVGRLKDRGYEQDQILRLIRNLYTWELTPLLVYDYQPIEQNYIDDVQSHRDVNSPSHFEVSGSYYTPYLDDHPVEALDETMLVNKSYYLESNYVPTGLTELSNRCGATGTQLAAVAANAMEKWAEAGRNLGVAFYATSSYRSYDSQQKLYNNYVGVYGQTEADRLSAKAGYSEHQTGYTVDITATGEEEKDFSETTPFRWIATNSQDYGWILRYPEGKEDITGYEYESWHYRYVGTEIAQALYKSKLTYDEFYCLYLKSWNDETNKPSEKILKSTDYHNYLLAAEEPEN